jgi:hypothetical protein
MTSAGTACTGRSLSAGIRQHPPKTEAVVTQFVTQAWRCSCAAARRVTALQVFDANCWCGTIGLPASTRCLGAGRTADRPFFRRSGCPTQAGLTGSTWLFTDASGRWRLRSLPSRLPSEIPADLPPCRRRLGCRRVQLSAVTTARQRPRSGRSCHRCRWPARRRLG